MQTFKLLLVSAIALSGGAAAMTPFPVRENGLSDFCDTQSFDQGDGQLLLKGYCSPNPQGHRMMGAALFTSHIDVGKCLSNVNGGLVPSTIGGALTSCTCEVGFSVCPTCNATSFQCACKDISGGKKTTLTDFNTFVGLGLDSEGRIVLYCKGFYGDFSLCTKNGAPTACPPTQG